MYTIPQFPATEMSLNGLLRTILILMNYSFELLFVLLIVRSNRFPYPIHMFLHSGVDIKLTASRCGQNTYKDKITPDKKSTDSL